MVWHCLDVVLLFTSLKASGECHRFLFANVWVFPKTDSVCVILLFLVSFRYFSGLHIPDYFISIWAIIKSSENECVQVIICIPSSAVFYWLFLGLNKGYLNSYFIIPRHLCSSGTRSLHLGVNDVCGWEGNSTVLTLSSCSETRRMRSHMSPRWNHNWQDAFFVQQSDRKRSPKELRRS